MTMPTPMEETLPGARVLSYVARVDSPTRVRRISAWSMLVLAAVYSGAGMVLGGIAIYDIYSHITLDDFMYAFGGGSGSVPGMWRFVSPAQVREAILVRVFIWNPTIPAVLFLITSILAWVTFLPLLRGRRWAAIVAMPVVGLSMAVFILVGAGTGTGALLAVVPVNANHTDSPWLLLLLFPFALCLVLAPACFDLLGFLSWIRRQKMGEAPVRKFVG